LNVEDIAKSSGGSMIYALSLIFFSILHGPYFLFISFPKAPVGSRPYINTPSQDLLLEKSSIVALVCCRLVLSVGFF
jgi:hypothetical protein